MKKLLERRLPCLSLGREVAIDLHRQELEEAPPSPLFKLVMDARELAFMADTFDVVTASFTFLYISPEDFGRVSDEGYRVLAPGGRLMIWDSYVPARGDNVADGRATH